MSKQSLGGLIGGVTFLIALTVSIPRTSNAGLIYTTLGPNGEFSNNGATVSDSATSGPAARFISSDPFTIQSIDLGVSNFDDIELAVLTLYADSGGGVPGSILHMEAVDVDQSVPALATFDFSSFGDVLDADTNYWLTLHTNTGLAGWNSNSQGVSGVARFSTFSNAWLTAPFQSETTPAFQVNGTFQTASVPEPSSLTLMAVGVVGIAAGAVRRRQRERRTGT